MEAELTVDTVRELLNAAINRVLEPIRSVVATLTSRTARRTYITTVLISFTALALFLTAIIAYLTFYYFYIPVRGFSRPVYLQFDSSLQSDSDVLSHPHGLASLGTLLVSNQRYDVTMELRMPRTPTNLAAGNFMIDLQLLSPSLLSPVENVARKAADFVGEEGPSDIVVHSSRPTILEYRSAIMELRDRFIWSPWYITGWKIEEETVLVMMLENVVFTKGWRNVPTAVKVEIRSKETLQIYDCIVNFRARLSGLRYVMYNHRITSFILFTTLFYFFEVASLFVTWAFLSFVVFPDSTARYQSGNVMGAGRIKRKSIMKSEFSGGEDEGGELSDTSRTFPTFTMQPPLHYGSQISSRIKDEPADGSEDNFTNLPLAAGDAADDEDDDEADDFLLDEEEILRRTVADSGLGTSLESSGDRKDGVNARRRRTGVIRDL